MTPFDTTRQIPSSKFQDPGSGDHVVFAPDPPGQRHVLGHHRHPPGVDGEQHRVLGRGMGRRLTSKRVTRSASAASCRAWMAVAWNLHRASRTELMTMMKMNLSSASTPATSVATSLTSLGRYMAHCTLASQSRLRWPRVTWRRAAWAPAGSSSSGTS